MFDCELICKADREEFKKACTIDRSGMKFTKKTCQHFETHSWRGVIDTTLCDKVC